MPINTKRAEIAFYSTEALDLLSCFCIGGIGNWISYWGSGENAPPPSHLGHPEFDVLYNNYKTVVLVLYPEPQTRNSLVHSIFATPPARDHFQDVHTGIEEGL